jgi:hypothetical protein
MKIIYTLCAFLLAAAVGGCAHPKVIYSKVEGPDPDGAIKFKFAHSVLVTTAQLDRTDDITGYKIQSIPVAASVDPKYAIEGAGWYRNWGVETVLNATYQEGSSDLLKEVGVAIKDYRVDVINALASIAAGALSFTRAETLEEIDTNAPQQPPEPVDVGQFLTKPNEPMHPNCIKEGDDLVCHSNIDGFGWKMYIRINPPPKDALDVSTFKFPYSTNSYLYSACRNAQVSLKWAKDRKEEKLDDKYGLYGKTIFLPKATVQIADPNYLESLAFPKNGKVVAKGSCGAESTASDAKTSNVFDIISALVTAAKTVKDAADGKTSTSTPKAAPSPDPKTKP